MNAFAFNTRVRSALLWFLIIAIPVFTHAQTLQPSRQTAQNPTPEAALRGVLSAFDSYEVVAMPEAHGAKDLDDFILSVVRDPAFSEKVNDIAVECGNSLYQPLLDRYIAGEDVPYNEVRKVWRNTTQTMCGMSGFFEQFLPLVRAINRKLAPARRLRVLACDPPIDWEKVKTFHDILKLTHRDANISSVMEKEVFSKHRKALMLFGTFHIMHGVEHSAVSLYEKEYPNLTFVISDLGYFDTDLPATSGDPLASWPIPALARIKGTWLGALTLDRFLPPPTLIDTDCNVHRDFPKELQKTMGELVDALLYLGPQDLRLKEQLPADIALDIDYRTELQRRDSLPGAPGFASAPKGSLKEFDQQVITGADNPLFAIPKPRDIAQPQPGLSEAIQRCVDIKNRNDTPQ